MQWAIVIAAFLASAVEFVEAFTLVLVARITTNWCSAAYLSLKSVMSPTGPAPRSATFSAPAVIETSARPAPIRLQGVPGSAAR
jgi:hypothetical protein